MPTEKGGRWVNPETFVGVVLAAVVAGILVVIFEQTFFRSNEDIGAGADVSSDDAEADVGESTGSVEEGAPDETTDRAVTDERSPSEVSAEVVDASTPLDFSLLVSEQSNNLNWAVVDLSPDIAAYEVDGAVAGSSGFAFQLGGYSAQSEPPVVEADFNLSRDYSVLRAQVGLTDNSQEDDPVQVEVSNTQDGTVLFSDVVSVGSPLELDVSVVGVLRVTVKVTGAAQFSDSWLIFSENS